MNSKQVIHYLSGIEEYKDLDDLKLSEDKKKMIQQKLQLEKQSLIQARQRQKIGDLFLAYDHNPFFTESRKQRKEKFQNTQGNAPPTNLIKELTRLGKKPKQFSAQIFNQKKKFRDLLSQIQLDSEQSIYSIQKLTSPYDVFFESFKGTGNFQSQIENEKEYGKMHENLQIQDYVRVSLANVLKQKETSFFMNKDKEINIFTIAQGKEHEEYGINLLQKHNFSFTSIVDKIKKIKLPTYRQLSSLARKCMKGLPTGKEDMTELIDSYQLSYKKNELKFQDLVSMASGRFSQEFLSQEVNIEDAHVKDIAEDSSQQSIMTTIIYKGNQTNHKNRFRNDNQEAQEIHDFEKLTYNKQEGIYERKMKQKHLNIKNMLNEKQQLYQRTIKDKKMHQKIKEQVQEEMCSLSVMDRKPMQDKIIRKNKISKNKNDSIKLKTLLHALIDKNQYDQKVQSKMK